MLHTIKYEVDVLSSFTFFRSDGPQYSLHVLMSITQSIVNQYVRRWRTVFKRRPVNWSPSTD